MTKQKGFSNKEVAELLRNVATTYLLQSKAPINRFRIMAYENAASTAEHLTRELKDIWEEGKLREVPTIGESIAANLEELFKTGRSSYFEKILKRVPSSVFVLMKIPGMGPKKSYRLVKEFHLNNPNTAIADLKKIAKAGKIAVLENFGEKSQSDIIESIERYEAHKHRDDRMPLPYAHALAEKIIRYLLEHPRVKRVDALGSLRRKVATVGDIDLAAVVKEKYVKEVIEYFTRYSGKIAVDNAGRKKASIIVSPNIQVDLRLQKAASYGSMLQYFTGSKAHNINLREYALKKGLSLSEYGIRKLKDQNSKIKNIEKQKNIKTFSDEKTFYHYLGLQYIPPELREGTDEIIKASKNQIPKLLSIGDVKGDLHIHSSYDLKPSHDFGQNTYLEIVKKGFSLGYKYVGFTDHNPKITGLNSKEVVAVMKKRKDYIDKVFSTHPKRSCQYFIGLEVDILPDGLLALPEKAFAYVDFLIAAVHSSFGLNQKTMTKRVLRAMSYPKVKILGHPTGRLLGKREGYELNWAEIFSFAVQNDIALEINSWPQRLDLPDALVREGARYGVKYAINSDAHRCRDMDGLYYGVSVARRGWLEKESVVNTWSYQKMKSWIAN